MTRSQARQFFDHFSAQIPERLAMLQRKLSEDVSFSSWRADGSVTSLRDLSHWLEQQTERHDLSEEEQIAVRKSVSGPLRDVLPAMHVELNPLNYSYSRDVASYLGEVVRQRNPDVQWQLGPAKPRNSLCYNRPLLATPEHVFMEDPFWTVTSYMIEHARTHGRKRSDLLAIAVEWESRISNRR